MLRVEPEGQAGVCHDAQEITSIVRLFIHSKSGGPKSDLDLQEAHLFEQ